MTQMTNTGGYDNAKYYPQTDLHVALMFLGTVHNSITLVVDRVDYFAYIKREVINVLGVPSWNEANRLRYTEMGKVINLVSANDHEYEDQLRGVPEAEVYRVEGWNVSDVRHASHCECPVPLVTTGYYHGTDGRMHESLLCDECGKRIGAMFKDDE
jgi:hypothetical protein